MNLFVEDEKKHIKREGPYPYKVLKEKYKTIRPESMIESQLLKCIEDYHYWKNKLKEVNEHLVNLKKGKTSQYLLKYHGVPLPVSIYDLHTLNEKLFWWRSYYQKALSCYYDAKRDYINAQTFYSRYLETKNADRENAKSSKGKYLYRVILKHNVWTMTYFVRSDTDYLDEDNFKDEFEYDMHLAVERFGDKLKEFNWNAFFELSNIHKFYQDGNITADIEKVPESECTKLLLDFEEFHAWRNKEIPESKKRVTFEEFTTAKREELGNDACDHFGSFICEKYGALLEKQYYGHAARDLVFSIKKTQNYWQRWFDEFTKSKTKQGQS